MNTITKDVATWQSEEHYVKIMGRNIDVKILFSKYVESQDVWTGYQDEFTTSYFEAPDIDAIILMYDEPEICLREGTDLLKCDAISEEDKLNIYDECYRIIVNRIN